MSTRTTSASRQEMVDLSLWMEQQMEQEGDIQQLLENISPLISMKKMEALSWRYGLLMKKEEVGNNNKGIDGGGNNNSGDDTLFYDYEAEAEDDLFSPSGILSNNYEGIQK